MITSANGANYGFSLTESYDNVDFTSPSFTITPSSGTMTGGQPAQFSTSYDMGTVSVVLNGTTYSTTTGQTSMASADEARQILCSVASVPKVLSFRAVTLWQKATAWEI